MKINNNFKNFYVLGDSLSDTGTLIGVMNEYIKTTLTPWIKIYLSENSYYKGHSFTNGPVVVEIISKKLNIPLKPAWKFEFKNKKYEKLGNNYAIVGATTTEQDYTNKSLISYLFTNTKIGFDINILNEITILKQAKSMISQHNEEKFLNSLIIISIGGNDILNICKILEKNKIDLAKEKINESINQIKKTLYLLEKKKPRKVLILNCSDITKIPKFIQNYKKIKNKVQELINEYNKSLEKIISKKTNNFQLINLFKITQKLLLESISLNKNTTHACVSHSKIPKIKLDSVTFFTKKNDINDKNNENYFFWDNIHPSNWVHKKTADIIWNEIIYNL